MAAISSGDYRFARYGSDGNRKEFSESFSYDILDNTSVPRIAFNGAGTDQDQRVFWNAIVSGKLNDVLILEYLDTTARKFDTSLCTVRFTVTAYYVDTASGVRTSRQQHLALADRVTKTNSGTRTDPQGIDDKTQILAATIANEWNKILCFKPLTSENWQLSGFQRFVSDGT